MIVHSALISCSRSGTCRITFTTGAVVVGMEVGGQNIGPTSIIILCDLVGFYFLLLGGASPSPPNPTGIGGARSCH